MSTLVDQISKAKARCGDTDLEQLADYARDKAPQDLDTPRHLAERRQFLRDSLGSSKASKDLFERILAGNEIQDINYLLRGARAAKAVARISIRDSSGQQRGWGTGFLIAPSVLLTNNHVLPSRRYAERSEVHFDYELDVDGKAMDYVSFAFEPSELFHTSEPLDFTVVAIRRKAENATTTLSSYGWLPLVEALGKVSEGEWLRIIQHPRGGRKQVCNRENQLIRRDPDVLWYSTDTLGGSSGSPVFNNDWFVVALHHAGVPEEKDGRIQTIRGQDYNSSRDAEEDVRWLANEGVRVSRIVDSLRRDLAEHPLLVPVFGATPENSRIEIGGEALLQAVLKLPSDEPTAFPTPVKDEVLMNAVPLSSTREVFVRLRIDSSGAVSIVGGQNALTETMVVQEAAKTKKNPPAFDVPFNAKYDDRNGYASNFLGPDQHIVNLPKLGAALQKKVAGLIAADPQDAQNAFVLKYHNFSSVVHSERRFAIYTAANVDFGGRYDLDRPTDVWRTDPRIALEHQISNFYYASNQFDRGHLTRREDLEFGSTRKAALLSAADTCHWTNCVPQHSKFNQNKELCQGIERYLLEQSIEFNEFRAQAITGPILEESDPVWD